MIRKRILILGTAMLIGLSSTIPTLAETAPSITMENSGAYLFTWRPVDYGNGQSFAILVGGNTINESDVILNRGYDYGYTFQPNKYSRPWGQVPDLVNAGGVWAIPDNWSSLPEGIQPTTRIVLLTNNKNYSSNERYVDVVHLPNGVSAYELPPEVRKYLINVDGSDAGASDGTITSGWITEGNQRKYRKPDGNFVAGGWLRVDGESYYMNDEGIMLADTVTPDGIYVNAKGEKTNYMPGWKQDEKGWRYLMGTGNYAANTWFKDADGKWYYFNIGGYMVTDKETPDGYYVNADGVWDGNASTIVNQKSGGPGENSASNTSQEGWEQFGDTWKYKLSDGSYVTNAWKQDTDGKWYYFGGDSLMVTSQTTPDGYHVDKDGVWVENE